MLPWSDLILQYVCPTMGSIMASVMFAAPVRDLRTALLKGSLGPLNPFPWSVLAGNCLGWVVYGYYTRDPFVLAANLPGLVLSIWLNSGAAKLQYLELSETRKRMTTPEIQQQASLEQWDASQPIRTSSVDEMERLPQEGHILQSDEDFVMVPQERALLRVLTAWCFVIVYVGWFSNSDPASIVGIVVNANLIFFYGAPLQTIQTVIATKNSASIHVPTMIMNWTNTSFWIGYGVSIHNPVIIIPNAIGLSLGLIQGILKFFYPSRGGELQPAHQPLARDGVEVDTAIPPEEDLPIEDSR